MSALNISIIIATRNREAILWKTLEKAAEAIDGKSVEIIVLNDGDKQLIPPSLLSNKIILLNNSRKGVSHARNAGALHAQGSILFFVDDDMWINREIIDWIELYLIQNKNTDAVYNINWKYPPTLEEKLRNNKIGRYILSSEYNTMWGRMLVKDKIPANGLFKFNTIASCSLVLSKELFNKTGGYNESIIFQGEDIDFTIKVRNHSIPIYCVFDTILYHNHEDRLDLDGYLERMRKGYQSQFTAEKNRLIPLSHNSYNRPKRYIFTFFLITRKLWIRLYKIIPDSIYFEPIVNKLIGLLSGLERYSLWRSVFNKTTINR